LPIVSPAKSDSSGLGPSHQADVISMSTSIPQRHGDCATPLDRPPRLLDPAVLPVTGGRTT